MVAATLLVWSSSLVGQGEPHDKCLSYLPSVVSLEGTFLRKAFAGPPNHRSIRGGDKPEMHFVLDLEKPVCLYEDKTKPAWNPARSEVREVELLLEGEQIPQYTALIGRAVIATGQLSAVALHPVAPVYLVVDNLKAQISKADPRLKEFLQKYIGTSNAETKTTEYSAAFVDLKGDGAKEVIVYLSADGWCGTGGCTMLILAPEGVSYRVVTRIPAVRLPIWVFNTKSNGWRDIGVGARINGVEPLYEAILSFDGQTYPSGLADAPRSNGRHQGRIVMSEATASEPLYQ
jgi:hypothetical protein